MRRAGFASRQHYQRFLLRYIGKQQRQLVISKPFAPETSALHGLYYVKSIGLLLGVQFSFSLSSGLAVMFGHGLKEVV